ncbi:sulfotransferase [Marinococcus sp. PL1-022]|uniref:sulfotransferase n=1 Tax=Marinococcus sp. PL1-022 TaxID=3095363 RepID=UPI0029C4E5FE|nr:sulfotransferase [Marinococcus sp. PL1-022]MDX6154291.1 sulfotransferase [Marinococcus sp. PL1-022]
MTEPVFIISTGRSGSTAVSNCIRLHPALVSLSELILSVHYNFGISGEEWKGFEKQTWTGSDFWELLAQKEPVRLAPYEKKGLHNKEILYERTENTLFNEKTGLPAIASITLPHLTNEPDKLYQELEAVVPAFPEDSLPGQYRRLFEWMQRRFDGDTCVERSGFSTDAVEYLIDMFPKAKFVFLYRDPREIAVAFNRFQTMKMGKAILKAMEETGADPSDPSKEAERLGSYRWLHPDYFEIEQLRQMDMPYKELGSWISKSLLHAGRVIEGLPGTQQHWLRYEDLLETPERELERLITFINPPSASKEANEQWIKKSVAQINPKPDTWPELPVEKRSALEEATGPALRYLGYA